MPERNPVWRPRLRRGGCALLLFGAGVLTGAIGLLVLTAPERPPLQPWHRLRPREEITAARPARDFAEYRSREAVLFRAVEEQLRRAAPKLPPLSRYDPASPTHPRRFGRDWNRSFELAPAGGVAHGAVVLLHGLSDSPYSLRAVGELLARRGFHVVAPRLPGHGTVPASLASVTRHDWRAVVHVAVEAAAARRGDGPLLLVGYSNGAALALEHALAALDEPRLPRPDGLILVSPALAVIGEARLGKLTAWAARLPTLAALEWDPLLPESDPFKYTSFPLVAGYELHALTRDLESSLARLQSRGRLGELPPVLTLQSVVDDTIPAIPSLRRLYDRVLDAESELVLFDANRSSTMAAFLTAGADELLALDTPGRTFPFAVTLVTNVTTASDRVVASSRAPRSTEVARQPLALEWPRGVYSLSHVALPFPPDDPAYGVDAPQRGPLPLGRLELKGERGMLIFPPELVARLRYNPFFPYLAERVARFAERRRLTGHGPRS